MRVVRQAEPRTDIYTLKKTGFKEAASLTRQHIV